ncbi:MAG TPA: hypothetical protein VHR47_13295 [Bacillota bacterium]|nr:hypothetical protein [Bacillota bacterium]
MKRVLQIPLILLVFGVFLFSSVTRVNASTLVEPGKFIFQVKPGEKVTGAIKVTNVGDRMADVRACIYDWTLDAKDSLLFYQPGTREDSLKGMIKFNPQRFKLAKGESQIVRFTLTALKEETLERRCIVFFEEEDKVMNAQMGATVVTQVGSTIYMSVEPMRRAFRFVNTTVENQKGKWVGFASVKNEGKAHIRFLVNYKVISQSGTVIYEDVSKINLILPGFEREYTFPIEKKLTRGKYNLIMEFTFMGNSRKTTRTIPFTIE